MHCSTGNENDQSSRLTDNYQPLSLPYFHYIKKAHADALPTFAVCCSISSKSCITAAFKRSFFILTRCFYMTVMRTTYALVYIYNTMVYWISMKFCNTEFLHAPPITLSLSLSLFPLPFFFVSSFLAHFIV